MVVKMIWLKKDTKQEKEAKDSFDKKYTVDYSSVAMDYESNGFLIKINESIECGDAYSDELSLDEETNSLWVRTSFPIDDLSYMHESDEWFRELFKSHSSVKGLIRRTLIDISRW